MVVELPADEKTEAATPRRREEARKKGQVARSNELGSAFVLITAFVAMRLAAPYIFDRFSVFMVQSIHNAAGFEFTPNQVYRQFMVSAATVGAILAPVALSVVVVGSVVSASQVGLAITPQALAPNLNKFNVVSGLQRLMSMKSVVELVKAVLKVSIVGYVAYSSIRGEYDNLYGMATMDTVQMLIYTAQLTFDIAIKTGIVLIVLGVSDYVYQKFEFEKSIRMSKQELKEEYKQHDGDPLIRQRIRSKQREMSQQRMMQSVPSADVVVTNPTHYAVAIKYDQMEMDAPVVIAKGKGHVALKIREIASENGVPLVEDKPLAQALYRGVEIGGSIPPDLYKAVAEVLAFVYRLTSQRGARGR